MSGYILIGADFVPTKSNLPCFINSEKEKLVGSELLELLDKASYRIFNLETPLSDYENPIKKNGPSLIAPVSSINGYKSLGVDAFCLANNHIRDQGDQGVVDTLNALDNNGICHVGAGANLKDAEKPLKFDFEGKRVGVYACAEHEFSIASENGYGANPFDLFGLIKSIRELKDECDYVIVLYHGGLEHYRYPSPNLQRNCRAMIDSGVDLVLCQHSHCVGCLEEYKNGSIIYGQGNFLFDYCDDEHWKEGLLVKVDSEFRVSFVPISKTANTVRKSFSEEGRRILGGFLGRSEDIKEKGKIEALFMERAEESLCDYLLSSSSIFSKYLLRASRKLFGSFFYKKIVGLAYPKGSRYAIENIIDCESHRELFLAGLKRCHDV